MITSCVWGRRGGGRKSEAISPLLPVNRKGVPKRGESRLTHEDGGNCSVVAYGYMNDQGSSLSDKAGEASTPIGVSGGTIPGFQGPLFWSNPEGTMNTRFDDNSSAPFIVLLESRIPGKSLVRFNLIALGDLIDTIIKDTKRQIFPNGRNQAKVFCDRWQAAIVLVDSAALRDFGVHAYIPASLVQKKAFARNIPTEYSAAEPSTRLDPGMLSSILSIRRLTLDDGSASDRVEFVFSKINIPGKLSLASVVFDLTSVIPRPKR